MAALALAAVLLLAIVVGAALYFIISWLQNRHLGRHGFQARTFLTPNEVDFYRRLCDAAQPRWVVFAQVSMGALMNTRLKPVHPDFWKQRQLFAQKICDFVLCDRRTLEPQIIVELDDTMHDFDRDRSRDTLAASAGYRTLRFWSRKKPSVAELKQHIDRALALN